MKTRIGLWFENPNVEAGDPRPAQSSDQFLCFSGEHGTADDFNPSAVIKLGGRLYKHCQTEFG